VSEDGLFPMCAAWDSGNSISRLSRTSVSWNDSPYSFALKGLTRRIDRSLASSAWSHSGWCFCAFAGLLKHHKIAEGDTEIVDGRYMPNRGEPAYSANRELDREPD
jgi:hypothetical protein